MLAAVALAAAAMTVPPVTITVRAAPTVAPAIVKDALDEAAAVWRAAGVTLIPRIDAESQPTGRLTGDRRSLPLGLSITVLFDDGESTVKDYAGTVGWIVFDETNTPVPEIHLVYANALAILRGTYSDGTLNQMPGAQRQTYLSRALGRALAHELGHFLFQSKVHSEGGLMRARQSADALFGPDRKSFQLTDDERRAAAARLFEGDRLVRR